MVYDVWTISQSLVRRRKGAEEAGWWQCFETSCVNAVRMKVQLEQRAAESQVAVNRVKSKALKLDIKSGMSEWDVKSKMTLAKEQNSSRRNVAEGKAR